MLAVMFPGQGSQFRGMGADLFASPHYPSTLADALDAEAGFSIRDTCLEGDDATLRNTAVTQPCLFVVNALSYLAQAPELGKVACFLGHSLGEYNALWAAGAFDLLTGLRIVRQRGLLMERAPAGGMAAVLGLEAKRLRRLLAEAGLVEIDVANLNSPRQVVISGPVAALKAAVDPLEDAGASVRRLPVGAAFHSRYMAGAATEFAAFLAEIPLQPLRAPVISNVTGRPYPAASGARVTARLLVRQISEQVSWGSAIARLGRQGARFAEVGPGEVLTRMLPHILSAPPRARQRQMNRR